MKRILLYTIFLFVTPCIYGRVWLVDNNPGSPATLTNLQDAINNYAQAGDTIMVAGSPTSYGDVNITRSLTVIGEGYNNPLSNNTRAGLVHIQSSDVFFSGFSLSTRISLEASNAPDHILGNVTIERCHLFLSFLFEGGPPGTPYLMKDITIRNTISENASIFVSQNTLHDWILFDSLIVENSIFQNASFFNWGNNITGATTILFRNNLFVGQDGQNLNTLFYYTYAGTRFHDGIFYNNIFYACNPTGSVNCTFMNNLTYGNGSGNHTGGAPFGTGANDTLPGQVNNNIYSKDPMFVNYTPVDPFSYNADFHTAPGSPCIGTGVGGTDIGIYGGAYPFRISEGPRIPLVDFINISNSAVPNGGTFYLQFDARVRQ